MAGAIILGPLLSMATAETFTLVHGRFEGAAAMGGATIGGVAGLALGLVGGIWLVLRNNGHRGGTAVTCLTVGALFMIGCLGFVAFS